MNVEGVDNETRELYEMVLQGEDKNSIDEMDEEQLKEELLALQEADSNDRKSQKTRSQKRKRRHPDDANPVLKSEIEKNLEKILFGDKSTLLENLKKTAGDESDTGVSKQKEDRKPAWHDSDDEQYVVGNVILDNKRKNASALHKDRAYKYHLEKQFTRLQTQPKWADLDREREVDSDEELMQSIGHLSSKKDSAELPKGTIQFKKLKDVNRSAYAERGITSLQFHPTSTVALVAGLSGVASLYSIDGLKNDKLHSVKFENYPIKCAKILPSGTEVLFGGSSNYYYSFDLMKAEETRIFLPKTITKLTNFEVSPCGKIFAVCGRFGEIHILDTGSKELLHTLKQEEQCTALHFSKDSNKLFSHSDGSEVSIFDVRQNRIEHIFADDGCIKGRTLAISPSNNMIATGSNEGVVNVYEYNDVLVDKYPKPKKIIYNLTTSITCTKFNHNSEILGICSSEAPNAVKMVHFPSATVFSNFPGHNACLGNVRIVEFSPRSGFLTLANSRKEVPLYRLQHYCNY